MFGNLQTIRIGFFGEAQAAAKKGLRSFTVKLSGFKSQIRFLKTLSEQIRHFNKKRSVHLQKTRLLLPESKTFVVVTVVVADVKSLAGAGCPAECVLSENPAAQGVVINSRSEIDETGKLISRAESEDV